MSASKLIAIECGAPSRAYMACKKRDANPETCLAEGDAVTGCVINLCVPSSHHASTHVALHVSLTCTVGRLYCV